MRRPPRPRPRPRPRAPGSSSTSETSSSLRLLLRRYITRRLNEYYNQPSHLVVGSTGTTSTTPGTGTTSTTPGNNSTNTNTEEVVGGGGGAGATAAAAATTTSSHVNNNTIGIDFSKLWGQELHWKLLYSKLYQTTKGQWLTPVELFQPYYTKSFAQWYYSYYDSYGNNSVSNDSSGNEERSGIHQHIYQQQHLQHQNLHLQQPTTFDVIEFGGGRGTNARWFIDYYLEGRGGRDGTGTATAIATATPTSTTSSVPTLPLPQPAPQLNRYTIVDTSTTLQQLQRQTLEDVITLPRNINHNSNNHNNTNNEKHKTRNGDGTDASSVAEASSYAASTTTATATATASSTTATSTTTTTTTATNTYDDGSGGNALFISPIPIQTVKSTNDLVDVAPKVDFCLLDVADIAEGVVRLPLSSSPKELEKEGEGELEAKDDGSSPPPPPPPSATTTDTDTNDTLIMAFELFDNLGHDKVRFVTTGTSSTTNTTDSNHNSKNNNNRDATTTTTTTKTTTKTRTTKMTMTMKIEQAEVVVTTSAADAAARPEEKDVVVDVDVDVEAQAAQAQALEEVQVEEMFRPLGDPLLKKVLDILMKISISSSASESSASESSSSSIPKLSPLCQFLRQHRHRIQLDDDYREYDDHDDCDDEQNGSSHNTNVDESLHRDLHHRQDHRHHPKRIEYVSWIPTVAYGLLIEIARQQRPNTSTTIVIADFDYLPPPELDSSSSSSSFPTKKTTTTTTSTSSSSSSRKSLPSTDRRQEPLVTDMDDHDYECYLQAHPNLVDILFPTDFQQLHDFCQYVFNNNNNNNDNDDDGDEYEDDDCTNSSNKYQKYDIRVEKQAHFLQRVAPNMVDKTRTGTPDGILGKLMTMIGMDTSDQRYSPMIHDFSNCSVLTITPRRRRRRPSSSETKEKETNLSK